MRDKTIVKYYVDMANDIYDDLIADKDPNLGEFPNEEGVYEPEMLQAKQLTDEWIMTRFGKRVVNGRVYP